MAFRTGKSISWVAGLAIFITAITSPTVADLFQSVSQPSFAFPPLVSGSSDSDLPIISADGRFVLFTSTAGNLVARTNKTPTAQSLPRPLNAFLRDRSNGIMTLLSVNGTGISGGNDNSIPVDISTNGQFALLESSASNLIGNDTNNSGDVFVRDVINGTTILVSVSTNGSCGNGTSDNSVMTPNGRYVAFVSAASDLVSADTNLIPDIFVRDLQFGVTTIVSVGASSAHHDYRSGLLNGSESPVLTPDGRYVAFYSAATNLVSGVETAGNVYVRDLVAGTTECPTANVRDLFFPNTEGTNVISCSPHLSDDGRFIAFIACTNQLNSSSVPGIALRHDMQAGITEVVHADARVSATFETAEDLDMTPDGRFIAFVGNVPGPSGDDSAVYLWDAQTVGSTLISADTNGLAVANSICDSPTISANGQIIGFVSDARGLTTNELNGEFHLYRHDLTTGLTRLVNIDLYGRGGHGINPITGLRLNADGSLITFATDNAWLVANDRNRSSDVFVRDFTTDTTELISAHHSMLPSFTPSGVSGTYLYSVNADARYVTYASTADDVVTNDTNGLSDVFVRDLLTGSNILVSAGANGFAGAGQSLEPSISGDGRYVAFSSFATNLTANDTNARQDVLTRHLLTGATALVSVSMDGVTPGNEASYQPTLNVNGRFVLFRSKASNLVFGSFTGENLFLRDLQTATTYALTTGGLSSAAMTPDGRFVASVDNVSGPFGPPRIYVWNTQFATRSTNTTGFSGGITSVAISPDGTKLVASSLSELRIIDRVTNTNFLFASGSLSPRPGLQFSGDGRFFTYALFFTNPRTNQVFAYDFKNNTSLLVSKSFDSSLGGSGVSDSPTISADGRFVIFRSAATNIVAGDTNGFPDLFVYDRMTGTNTLLTQSRFGSWPADQRSRAPVFSANGRMVLFQSWASDLSTGDFNQLGDLFAFEFVYLDIAPENSPEGGKTLSWPAAPGQNFRVQYKNNVSDSDWQDLTAPIIVTGNRAFLTNVPPIPDQRFYRVITE